MLFRKLIAVYTKIHSKHINTRCVQKVKLLNVKPSGTDNDHWALEG